MHIRIKLKLRQKLKQINKDFAGAFKLTLQSQLINLPDAYLIININFPTSKIPMLLKQSYIKINSNRYFVRTL